MRGVAGPAFSQIDSTCLLVHIGGVLPKVIQICDKPFGSAFALHISSRIVPYRHCAVRTCAQRGVLCCQHGYEYHATQLTAEVAIPY